MSQYHLLYNFTLLHYYYNYLNNFTLKLSSLVFLVHLLGISISNPELLAARSIQFLMFKTASLGPRKSKPSLCCTINVPYCLLVVVILFTQWTAAVFLPFIYSASWTHVIYWTVRGAIRSLCKRGNISVHEINHFLGVL